MKNVNLNIRISPQIREEFKRIAKEKAQNPSELIRRWIEEYIDKNKEKTRSE